MVTALQKESIAQIRAAEANETGQGLPELSSFAGTWAMDLGASDSLHNVLRALGLNYFLILMIDRLGVTQEIMQTDQELDIHVKTMLGSDHIRLALDGSRSRISGPTGEPNDSVSTWRKPESGTGKCAPSWTFCTRQTAEGQLDNADAVVFVTERSLDEASLTLFEVVSVQRPGSDVVTCQRILRRQ